MPPVATLSSAGPPLLQRSLSEPLWDQPWSYRYCEITLSCPVRVRAQLTFRAGNDLGVGRPSIYTTASVRIPSAGRVVPHNGQYEGSKSGQYPCRQQWSLTPGVRPMTSVGC